MAVLCTGGGSNLQVLLDRARDGSLGAVVDRVASNRADSLALERAHRAGVPAVHLSVRTQGSEEALARALVEWVRGADLLVLAGYLRPLAADVLDVARLGTINIHPSLLPSFGGVGMYGMHVHRAVVARGCRWTGVTVHRVNTHYDEGPILVQRPVAVHPSDTPDDVARRVLTLEHDTLWRVVKDLCGELCFQAPSTDGPRPCLSSRDN